MATVRSIERRLVWRVVTQHSRKQLEQEQRCTWDDGERYCAEKGLVFDPREGWRCLEHAEAGEGEAS